MGDEHTLTRRSRLRVLSKTFNSPVRPPKRATMTAALLLLGHSLNVCPAAASHLRCLRPYRTKLHRAASDRGVSGPSSRASSLAAAALSWSSSASASSSVWVSAACSAVTSCRLTASLVESPSSGCSCSCCTALPLPFVSTAGRCSSSEGMHLCADCFQVGLRQS